MVTQKGKKMKTDWVEVAQRATQLVKDLDDWKKDFDDYEARWQAYHTDRQNRTWITRFLDTLIGG